MVVEAQPHQAIGDKNPILRLTGVSKGFGVNVVLEDVTFDLRAGEILGIIGPSGGGKTTLLKCIDLLEMPETGTVEYFGRWKISNNHPHHLATDLDRHDTADDLTEKLECLIRRKIGFVFQSFNLWEERSVLQNLVLAPVVVKGVHPAAAEKRASDLCHRFGLSGKLAQDVWQLSGGERQRVAIIRALLMDPEILLLDEITSALDPVLTLDVLQTIRELRDLGLTMILVTHHIEFASSVCDRMMFLSRGKILQLDSPATLRQYPATKDVRSYLEILKEAS
jgi:ABC-type polar amino acid transport system ATPase subunit